jgi:hypothetical protein
MDRFLRFAAGAAIAIAYWVVAVIAAFWLSSVVPDLWLLCFGLVVAGWIAMCIVALRQAYSWIAYGLIAGPFIALLVATLSCFATLNAETIEGGSGSGVHSLP